jgi:Leucine-rich repeat (LRR) protein
MTLNLSNKQLKTLPDIPEWIDGKPITKLILFNNKLTELPENLPNTIEVLDVQQNHLTHLPKNLPNKLIRLYLAHNKVSQINLELFNANIFVDWSYNCVPFEPIKRWKNRVVCRENQFFVYGNISPYKCLKYYRNKHKNMYNEILIAINNKKSIDV